MPQFRYVARSAEGKLVDGVVTSNDRSAAIREVEQQRFVPIRIEAVVAEASAAPARRTAPKKKAESTGRSPAKTARSASNSAAEAPPSTATALQKMSHSQKHLFTEQLANLLGAGMTLDEALGIL